MGEPERMETLLALFEKLGDPRVERTKAHGLTEILFLTLSAVISGVNHLTQVERFGNAKLDWFRTILPYVNGIPSHDTIGRVLGILDPGALEVMFATWMTSTAKFVDGVVAIDGKTLRRAIRRGGKKSFVHMVSAFASANSMVLGQIKTDEKSNEITAIPRLLEALHLKGAIVTIDAAGCQEAITDSIVDRGADFVIAVKGNQPTLHKDIIEIFEGIDESTNGEFSSTFETEEVAHGRGEHRRCDVVHVADVLTHGLKWRHVNSVIRVTSERFVDGSASTHARYFMSSVEEHGAEHALKVTRSHWAIENSLHWVLDVAFREDECRVYAENAAENLAVVRHMALNQLRAETNLRGGIASKRNQAAWTDEARVSILCARVE